MQTFLPYPGFRASAAVLDDRRLGKQRVETYQILRALVFPRYAWKNHPAVRMWRGFTPALVAYGLAVADEWRARGRADATRESLLAFAPAAEDGVEPRWDDLRDRGRLPPWLGSPAVHVSHRSALLRKDPELYRPLFPDEPDDLPYEWPVTVFRRWPVRRGSEEPLSVEAAAELLGLEDPPAEVLDVVAAAARGQGGVLSVTDRRVALDAAVLAGLSTPGRTLWVVPGPALGDDAPAPPPAPAAGGKVSPVTARPPEPEDLAATAAEAAAEPETVFLRAGSDVRSGPDVAAAARRHSAGLVVLDGTGPDGAGPDGVGPEGVAGIGDVGVPVLRLDVSAPPREEAAVEADGGGPVDHEPGPAPGRRRRAAGRRREAR